MGKTKTTRYDAAEHLRSPEEMAAYLETCREEANDDAAFVITALGDMGNWGPVLQPYIKNLRRLEQLKRGTSLPPR